MFWQCKTSMGIWMLNKSCGSLALEAHVVWISRTLSSHQQRVWSIYTGHKSISCFIFYSLTHCAAKESPLVFCGFQRETWQRSLLQWRERCSVCTPGEWDLMSANWNFLEPGKIINGTKKPPTSLNPYLLHVASIALQWPAPGRTFQYLLGSPSW